MTLDINCHVIVCARRLGRAARKNGCPVLM
jgi:hypothetical protein